MTAAVDVVIPTIGRPSLQLLLDVLTSDDVLPWIGRIVVVDDRPGDGGTSLEVEHCEPVEIVRSGGRGPAAARNAGWRRCAAAWVSFLDDDVVPRPGWGLRLAADVSAAASDVAAIQGRVRVPLPEGPSNDAERNVQRLETADWITADMVVRRAALEQIGGFDERFTRAYREDTDLALRLVEAGHRLTVGERGVDHPVRPGRWTDSIRAQRGNLDDALMRRLHGRRWRERGRSPRGMLPWHVVTTTLAVGGLAAAAARRRRLAMPLLVGWGVAWCGFVRSRVSRGRDGVVAALQIAITSAVIPPVAVTWRIAGWRRARRLAPHRSTDRWRRPTTRLVLFDRDGTLIDDVPYNGDPSAVIAVPGAREALDRLRSSGLRVGLITNQSGVGRGLLDEFQVERVNERVATLLGPFTSVQVCPHTEMNGCRCRKPEPGLVLAAAAAVGVGPEECVVVGDIGADVEAGLAAGAGAILVPTAITASSEIRRAPKVEPDLAAAVDSILRSRIDE